MQIISFIILIISLTTLIILMSRLGAKVKELTPTYKIFEGLIMLSVVLLYSSSFIFGVLMSKPETDTIKDYNKGLYQEKITYESIDGNIIPQDTVYIFKR